MSSRTRTRFAPIAAVLLTVPLGLAGLATDGAAQVVPVAPPDSGSARVTGFGGLGWGSARATVEERWGPPDTVRRVRSLRAEALIYADRSVLDEQGAMGFLVHPDSGLVRGLYLLPYEGGDDCRRLYVKFRDAVGRALGDLEGEESRANRTEDLEFCTAFQLGRAMAQTVWRDTARGSRVWVRLDRGAGAVRVSYESPAFRGIREQARRTGAERWLGGDGGGADTTRVPGDTLEGAVDSSRAGPGPASRARARDPGGGGAP